MIKCKELNKSFDTKHDLFLALKANKDAIIKQKKAELKESRSTELPLIKDFDFKAPFPTKKGFFYPIINSTNIIDSHKDLHLPTIWNKSAKEQNGKVSYVTDHEIKINNIICYPEDVNIQLHKTTFKDIGYDLEGETTLLVYEMLLDSVENDSAKNVLQKRRRVENSIRMAYVDMKLCINSKSPDFINEKEDFDTYIKYAANKDLLGDLDYFWAIPEAKIVKEGSMVMSGSNPATHIFYHKDTEAVSNTSDKSEPSKDTQTELKDLLTNIKFK